MTLQRKEIEKENKRNSCLQLAKVTCSWVDQLYHDGNQDVTPSGGYPTKPNPK